MIKFLDLQKQYLTIQEEIDNAIKDVIINSEFIGGKHVKEFENNFAKYHKANYCIGVGNGTDALEIAIWSLNLPNNSEVIVPSNSFIATSEAVSRNNLKIVFADCKDDYTICPQSIKENITEHTAAIIPVHLYGHPADMIEIMNIATKYNLKIIEDSAQAHGAELNNEKIGTFGDLATFSFYPGKNLGAYGDAGAIITNNKILKNKCRMYANHGRSSKFSHEIEGINSRLDGIQAAVLNVKLKYLNSWIEKRNTIANLYIKKLQHLPIQLPTKNDNITHVWHLFVIQSKEKEQLKQYLINNNIQVGTHYPISLPNLQAYQHIKQDCTNFKSSKEEGSLLSLPISEQLEENELMYIIEKILDYFKKRI
jgi:dTDP-4-amino-4,6-dideoxygalactose transaminase